jgi:hypothetical protein
MPERHIGDGHSSPVDLEAISGNLVSKVEDIQRGLQATRRRQTFAIRDGMVTHPNLWPSNAYDDDRGIFTELKGIDAVQLVSGNDETVIAGMQCIAGEGTAYFEVSAHDDAESYGGTAYGWRAGESQNIDLSLRHYGAGGSITATYMTGETARNIVVAGADTWQSLQGGTEVYQSFLAPVTGVMTGIALYVDNDDGYGDLEVRFGEGTIPPDVWGWEEPWYSFPYSIDSLSGLNGAWGTIWLPVAQTLQSGSAYYVSVHNPENYDVKLYKDTGNGYADGNGGHRDSGGSWTADATHDYYLKLLTMSEETTEIAAPASYQGWTETTVNIDARFRHDFYSADNAADFYVSIPDDMAINALRLADTESGGEVHWRAGHVRTPHIREEVAIPTGWTFRATALTNSSWDGDTKNLSDDGTLDLSSLFSVPAGVKAVLVLLTVKDNAAGDIRYVALGPSSGNYSMVTRVMNSDVYNTTQGVVPCDANGDIYVKMSGDNIDYVHLSIWGYYQG